MPNLIESSHGRGANAYMWHARFQKVQAIVNFCRIYGFTSDMLECAGDAAWRTIAFHAGTRPPSDTSKALVILQLKGVSL